MGNPKISVIVPVYKVEPYLRLCIDSIVNQTYKNLEIILVDDGSPDSCGDICDEYAEKDNRIVVIHKENGGLSSARNVGIKCSHGDFLCFIDSDDAVHTQFIEALYDACNRTGAEIAMCRFSDEAKKLGCCGGTLTVHTPREISMKLCMDATGVLGVAWNKLYAARLFKEISFPEGRIHEDEATIYRLYWECQSCALLADTLYYYRTREGSIVNSVFSQRRMDAALAYRERIEFYHCREERKLADYSKAVYCHFLRKYQREIRACTCEPAKWRREMWNNYAAVMQSDCVTWKKKASLSLQMLWPKGYEHCKNIYRRMNGGE